ncbi:MAG TPA: glycosyltransferase [Segetibacter sp.]|jgi:glycosyltransferase involved in cell wall biosynthesis
MIKNDTVSVITICFNNLTELIETCKSIDEQTSLPDEHLIVDGSTTEDINEWLSRNVQPSFRKWVHEPDKGISDAINKGIRRSSSTIIHLLHSGDKYYTPNAIAIVKNAFGNNPNLMWTHSKYVQNRGNVDVVSGATFDKNLLWKGMRTVAHPTMFVRKKLYDTYGLFNEHYKIAMDYDFLVRIRNERFQFIPEPLVYFSPGGASDVQFKKGLAEVREIYNKNVGNSFKLQLWQFRQRLLAFAMKTNFGRFLFKLKNKKNIKTLG